VTVDIVDSAVHVTVVYSHVRTQERQVASFSRAVQ
jgi:hypothetical protein